MSLGNQEKRKEWGFLSFKQNEIKASTECDLQKIVRLVHIGDLLFMLYMYWDDFV